MDSDITLNASLQETTHDLLDLVRPSGLPNRSSTLMLMAAFCTFSCVALFTVPSLIFTQTGDNPYSLFSQILQVDPASFLPISLTGLCSASALVLAFPRLGDHHASAS